MASIGGILFIQVDTEIGLFIKTQICHLGTRGYDHNILLRESSYPLNQVIQNGLSPNDNRKQETE